MKMHSVIATLVAIVALSGCGGGGGGGTSTATPAATTAPVTPTTPATTPTTPATPATPTTPTEPVPAPAPVPGAVNPLNPYTGQPASGSATTMVSGMVVSNITVGATVKAYAILPNGSNGGVLGVSSATGADGKFTMQLTSTPTGMVRFVATGGSFISEADGSKQANTATELVTPFVTTDLNFFVITPATHYVSHLVSYNAKAGSDLVTSYINSFGSLMSLATNNKLLVDDAFAGINLLKTVPGSVDDTRSTYQDVLSSFEWFGVRYDLPSSVVIRLFAAHAENNAPPAGVDGSGVPINVGQWVNGIFDETQPLTLDELTARKNSDGTMQRGTDGKLITDIPEGTLQWDLLYYFYYVRACADTSAIPALLLRYTNIGNIPGDPKTNATYCAAQVNSIAALKARIPTNNRSK
ncbi:hypothetical protein [Massilia sp. S19_KUP03_FR1]|uniref:hypothetical protein n=1 Tax=Massilia sp. S19_KUP03_FR1 TaxID=3025503 RepID=UPI002FCDA122